MSERKYLPIEQFRELGYLQEVNRLVLHPCGLAMSVRVIETDWAEEEIANSPWMQEQVERVADVLYDAVGFRVGWHRGDPGLRSRAIGVCMRLWPKGSQHLAEVWDSRDDPEGFVFGDGDPENLERENRYCEERLRHRAARLKLFDREYADATLLDEDPPDVEPTDWIYPEGGVVDGDEDGS